MKCIICHKNECSEDNNVCEFCSTTGLEYKQEKIISNRWLDADWKTD